MCPYPNLSANQLGKRLREQREHMHFSTGYLAELCGRQFTHKTVESYEQGNTYPAYANLILLLNSLEISFDELVCGGERQLPLPCNGERQLPLPLQLPLPP